MAGAAQQYRYRWQGRRLSGERCQGELFSQSLPAARAHLQAQGLRALRLRQVRERRSGRGGRIRASDIALFTRQLATLLQAGLPLVQAFDSVISSLNHHGLRRCLQTIRDGVAAGSPLAEQFRQHPEHFDGLYCQLIAIGEQSGTLDTLLDRLAQQRESSEALRQTLRKGLSYPLTVIVIALGVTALLLVKVVPAFAETFDSFGAELPAATQAVLSLSAAAQTAWLPALALSTLVFLACRRQWQRSPTWRKGVQNRLLQLPLLGPLLHQTILARFTRCLATTLNAGLPLLPALQAVAGACGHPRFEATTLQVCGRIAEGENLSIAMRDSGLFPPLLLQLVSAGEEAGALDTMLARAASLYEEAAERSLSSLTRLIEPLIMGILGILLGGLMLALYLPIFQIGSVL